MKNNRFEYEDGVILDTWTGYTYEYNVMEDWGEICGLLNQIHNILEKTLEI